MYEKIVKLNEHTLIIEKENYTDYLMLTLLDESDNVVDSGIGYTEKTIANFLKENNL